METLIQRLVANPHDEEALAYAHHAGAQDPRSYAILLEKVGQASPDPAYAAHWLSEAANVWSTTIGDAHHAARTLMAAIEKDPTQRTAAERLAQLYREKGDQKALVALLERLVKSLAGLVYERPEVRSQLAALHEELGRLWSEPPLARPERALENWRRLAELDPQNAFAIYTARELLKQQQQFVEAIPYFAMEQALIDDVERKLALFRDEADVRRRAGDLAGASQALRNARSFRPDDAALKQELGTLLVERAEKNEAQPAERDEAAQLFVSLAETYDGEYGFSYSVSALRASPGHDRAMQLADYYGTQLNRIGELAPRYASYLQVNPGGFMAGEARAKSASARPLPGLPPPPPGGGQGRRPGDDLGRASSPGFRPIPGAAPSPRPADAPSSAGQSFQRSSQVPASTSQPEPAPAASPAADLGRLLEEAQSESQKSRKPQALVKFREALKLDPANPEALSWVEDHLRQKRMYADLRDVLLAASRVPSVSIDTRKAQLRDVAGLCESQLRDVDTAITAWKQICQIDRGDDQARDQLRRLLEKGSRWDDLAAVLEQDAMSAPDAEQKIGLERKLATLHEQKRKDPGAAGEAWARIANLAPEDDQAIQAAVKLFEKAERFDQAAQLIADTVGPVTDKVARTALLQKLGELRIKTNDQGAAGEAYAEAAEAAGQAKLWELAERSFMAAERFADAANALDQRAQLADGKQQAALYAQASEMLERAGDTQAAVAKLEQATELDPANEIYAQALDGQYRKSGRESDLVAFLLSRSEKLGDRPRRTAARRAAAVLQRQLGDSEGARESLLLLLSDGDDAEALHLLIEDAVERSDFSEAVELLRRLGAMTKDPAEKLAMALREASILADNVEDTDGAIERYEAIYKSLDPKSRIALHAIADLEEKRNNPQGAADALEREVPLADGPERVELSQRLAQLYEGPLANPRGAIKALEIVHEADPEDFDAIARLEKLSEQVEDWPRVATLMAALIEVEGDEEEASTLTQNLAGVLADKLGKGDEALAALEKLADPGDEPCREAYVRLGDALGWKGIVAMKLVSWNESGSGPARNEALRSAFDRFLEIGREADAARVAMELSRSRGTDRSMAEKLEDIAARLRDLDALAVAHDLLGREVSGSARATELVRQAEVQVGAGIDPADAMQHGESGLASVPPAEVEPLLARLGALAPAAGHIIDLYERQVGRCRAPADRLAALARAAQVAAERGAAERARSFFELALGGGVQEDTIAALEGAARLGDEHAGGIALRAILAEALAGGGQGSRDGGRTRGALLRRAANLAHRDLGDVERAFRWLGDALITHVEDASLEALEALGHEVSDLGRVEATLSRALEEVFDGPLVRKLLHRRARLRRDTLGDRKGAAVDLKKLHDLSPADQDVMNDLSSLLLELGDHRGMIQLYEDQILRGRDPAQRAELARKVARIWEEDLGDARESADAWRRVLRMKAADPEATAGLDRSKSGKLKRAPPPPVIPGGASSPPAMFAPPSAPAPAPSATPEGFAPPAPLGLVDPPTEDPFATGFDEEEATQGTSPEAQGFAGHPGYGQPAHATAPGSHGAPPGHEQADHEAPTGYEQPPPQGAHEAAQGGYAQAQHPGYQQPHHGAHDATQGAYDQAELGRHDQGQHAGYEQPPHAAAHDPAQAGYDQGQPPGYGQAQHADYDQPQQAGYDQPPPGAAYAAHRGYDHPGHPAGGEPGFYADPGQAAHEAHAGYAYPQGGHPDTAPHAEETAEVDDVELLEDDTGPHGALPHP